MVSVTFGDELQDLARDDDELDAFLAAAPAGPPQMAPNPAAARFRAQTGGEPELEEDGLELEEFEGDPEPFEKTSGVRGLLGRSKGSGGAKAKGRRPTATIQKDIRAKTALLLSMPATVWEVRDEYCGGAALAAVPAVSDALADIFCDSPEIVAWFTSSGQFIKWLTLAAALKELTVTIVQHHITHSIGDEEQDEDQPADSWAGYVA